MKRLAFILIAAVLLTGCNSPEKKPVLSSIPSQQSSSSISSSESSSASESSSKQTTSSKSSSSQKSSSASSSQVSSSINEVLLGAETVMVSGKPMLKNPDSPMVLVNKTHNLSADWKPDDLVIPNVAFPEGKAEAVKYMRKDAAKALERLFNGALEDGIKLYGVSGYRSYARQQSIYNNEVKNYGVDAANKAVAQPGQSEHQTGLAMDVSCASMGYGLDDSFENTKEGKWLKAHAVEYGFIIRYQKDKVDITGYMYEPWHVRYVGKDAANYITANNITFDQYYTAVSKR